MHRSVPSFLSLRTCLILFFFSSRRRHTRLQGDWSSDVCSSDLVLLTKADKLTRAEQAKVLSITRLNAGGGEVRMFSALKKQGVDEVAQLLWHWSHPEGLAQPAAAAPQADVAAATPGESDSPQD